jgi:hypothetical protein
MQRKLVNEYYRLYEAIAKITKLVRKLLKVEKYSPGLKFSKE